MTKKKQGISFLLHIACCVFSRTEPRACVLVDVAHGGRRGFGILGKQVKSVANFTDVSLLLCGCGCGQSMYPVDLASLPSTSLLPVMSHISHSARSSLLHSHPHSRKQAIRKSSSPSRTKRLIWHGLCMCYRVVCGEGLLGSTSYCTVEEF